MRNVKKLLDKREATDMAKVAKSSNSNLFHLVLSILNYQYKIGQICVVSNQRLTPVVVFVSKYLHQDENKLLDRVFQNKKKFS